VHCILRREYLLFSASLITHTTAMPLPDHYLITPNPDDEAQFLAALGQSLLAGTQLMLFKAGGLDDAAYRALASQVIALAHD
jgi:thiamine monophosphate synthase